jgi:hypothetical protein
MTGATMARPSPEPEANQEDRDEHLRRFEERHFRQPITASTGSINANTCRRGTGHARPRGSGRSTAPLNRDLRSLWRNPMSWFNQVSEILKQYTGTSASTPPPDAHADFARISEQAPPSVVSSGLTEAFRSQDTPPFADMVAHLFGQSDGSQRAGILNHLIAAAGPAALSGGLLSSLKGAMSGSGAHPSVSPEEAQQIQPDAVRQLAEHAQKRDPSIVERASDFYAQHPTLVKGLGTAAVAMIIRHISSKPH